ncbi:MAG: AraC family transcriptional regulator [Clostridia bacterium]|nr:AraC family transcriptional regulator [Clostridia bacterium]
MSKYYSEGDTILLSERSEIIVEKCLVNESVDLHRHSFIEIAYVDSGEGVHEIADGYVSKIVKGDLMLFNSGVAHGYRVTPPSSLVIYNCNFDPAVLGDSVSRSDDFIQIVYSYLFETSPGQGAEQKPYILLRNADAVSEIIKEMFREYTGRRNGFSKINTANLTRLLVTIFRLKRDSAESSVDPAYKAAIAESAVRYINEYYASNISCGMLAARAFVSTGYFHKVFREVTGQTPVGYIQSVRLSEAARLLRETSLSVGAAAGSVGYSDLKYFYEIFRKEFGMTPGEYRSSKSGAGQSNK